MTRAPFACAVLLLLPATASSQAFQKDRLRPVSELVLLADGDSVRLLAAGPTDLRSGPTGLMVVFDPLLPLSDTVAIRRKSVALFRSLGSRVATARPFVLLRAQRDLGPGERFDQIIEWHDDDQWYAPGGTIERVE